MTKPELIERACSLRTSATDAERELWFHLRDRRLGGHKFKRQDALFGYIADFARLDSKLVIELDGSQHFDRQAYDARRSTVFAANGWRVLHFWNNDALMRKDAVLDEILRALGGPLPNPSPAERERG